MKKKLQPTADYVHVILYLFDRIGYVILVVAVYGVRGKEKKSAAGTNGVKRMFVQVVHRKKRRNKRKKNTPLSTKPI